MPTVESSPSSQQCQPQNVYCHKHRQRCRQNFDVTGFQPISGRSIIYIVQGDELDIFDTNTDTLAPGVTQLDVVGQAFDVVQIDP